MKNIDRARKGKTIAVENNKEDIKAIIINKSDKKPVFLA